MSNPTLASSEQTQETLSKLQHTIWAINESKGFHDDRPEGGQALSDWQGNKLMLIVSEAAEAQDEIRTGHAANETYYPDPLLPSSLVAEVGVEKARELIAQDNLGKLPKPEGVHSELADIVIRCFDFAATEGFELGAILAEKIAYNSTRPYKHGKKF